MFSPDRAPVPSVLVAVSIVVFNTPPSELAALLRQLSSTAVPHRIIVIDNSTTDALRSTASSARVEYWHLEKNIGFGAAHNLALGETVDTAAYHAVINPDISFSSDVIQDLFRFMEEHLDVGQVMPAVCNPDGTEQRLAKRLPTPFDLFLRRFLGGFGKLFAPVTWARYETRDLDLSLTREIPCLSGCFMFIRTSVLKKTGFFDETYFLYMEDIDLCRRIGSVAKTVIFPGTSVNHGYHKGSYRNIRLLLLHLQAAFHYFQKWGWFYDDVRTSRNRECGILVEKTPLR